MPLSLAYSEQSSFIKDAMHPVVFRAVKKISGLKGFVLFYDRVIRNESKKSLVERALDELNIRYVVEAGEQQHFSVQGPVIIIANHPFGLLDGIILSALVSSERKQMKILTNTLLNAFSEVREYIIPVCPFDSASSRQRNIASSKKTINYLLQGNAVGIFPAGKVAHFSLKEMRIVEPEWHSNVARIARMTKATVIPVYFRGSNSLFFHAIGLLDPLLRTLVLPREFIKKKGASIRLSIGEPIPYKCYESFQSNTELMKYFRNSTLTISGANNAE